MIDGPFYLNLVPLNFSDTTSDLVFLLCTQISLPGQPDQSKFDPAFSLLIKNQSAYFGHVIPGISMSLLMSYERSVKPRPCMSIFGTNAALPVPQDVNVNVPVPHGVRGSAKSAGSKSAPHMAPSGIVMVISAVLPFISPDPINHT